MEIKLARNEINGKPKTITLDKVTEIIEKEGQFSLSGATTITF